MMETCVSCNVKNNGMIAIYRHPNELDRMFFSVTGVEVNHGDHLCVPCYDDLRSAHRFKERCIQNSARRVSSQHPEATVSIRGEHSPTDVSTTCKEPVKEDRPRNINTRRRVEGNDNESHISMEQDEQQELLPNSTKEVNLCFEQDQEHFDDLNDSEEIIKTEVVEEFTLIEFVPEEKGDDVRPKDTEDRANDTPTVVESHEEDQHSQPDPEMDEVNVSKCLPRLPKVHSLMCEFCFKEFDVLADKIEHVGTHQSEQKPFKCVYDSCNGSFKDRVGLRAHVRIHAPIKRYGCRYCSMRFHTRGNRNAHERTHNGEKPFLCPLCNKGFAESGNLKNHIRFHNGERPYPCSMCDKSYRTHYSRSVHMRSHTNERPFLCDDCGKGFYSSGKLTIHQRTHTGERPFECSSCPARFADTCGLRRHVGKVH